MEPTGDGAIFSALKRLLRGMGPKSSAPETLFGGPIRGEPLGSEHLAERARVLAREQMLATAEHKHRPVLLTKRLAQTDEILRAARARLEAKLDLDVGPAGEWLLDNFHIIDEQIREVRESLPRGYYGELPVLANGPLAGHPRVFETATTLISHTEGRLDLPVLQLFFGAYQQVEQLKIGELWAIPAMLSLGLLENVRRMSLRTVQRLDEIDKASGWVARVQAASLKGETALNQCLDDILAQSANMTPVFVSRFLLQIRQVAASTDLIVKLERWITDEALSVDEADARANQRLAITQMVMANSITSLRAVAGLPWQDFVEGQSAMNTALCGDPAGQYAKMTFATRDRYRHVVERIAKRTNSDEVEVAEAAIAAARAIHVGDQANVAAHVGYHLVDDGLKGLEQGLGYRLNLREIVHRSLLRYPSALLFSALISGTAGLLGFLCLLTSPAVGAMCLLVAVFAVLPVIDVVIAAVNQLITAFLPPRLLPKLDLPAHGGIPDDCRTLVVIPTLFGSVAEVEEALETLEVRFLANREANLHFALLGDFVDADEETLATDAAIVKAASSGVRELNLRYADAGGSFHLFHRPRRFNPSQGVWMGWERKRGKLVELNAYLRGGAQESFNAVEGDGNWLLGVRYVITLDSDTVLPPEAAAALVGAIAHPLNRAVYDPEKRRVVRGYGILQPRVVVSLPSAQASRFAAIYSGHPGVDPYTTAVSDLYQDLFGEGSYTGKGIYDVDAFEQATHGRFPERRLLSHDLIEGSFARAGLVTDINVYDDYPSRYLTFTRRKHRWIRGDWQILHWLGFKVPGPHGVEANVFPLLSRWKIFDNLRRSVVEISQLAFLVAGWILLPGKAWLWTALALVMIAAPWAISLFLATIQPPLDRSWRTYYAALIRDAGTSVLQVGLTIAFLPHQAAVAADAICRTLYRLFVSRRRLLEWQTAQQVELSAANATWRSMWAALVLGFVLCGSACLVAYMRGGVSALLGLLPAVLPLFVLWVGSPAIAQKLNAPPRRSTPALSGAQQKMLQRYAKLHWAFFEKFVDEKTHWLAPDNFQETPAPVVAMRTSPTNIGLHLLAIVGAHDLGFISLEDTCTKLERAFATIDTLAKYNGHLYNWYDLNDLSVLPPAYVSTVDSGNFAGHLIALRQACLELAKQNGAAVRLLALAERAYALALAMDFRFLYDEQQKLFSIGFHEQNRTLDAANYDLLASEARLASFVAVAKGDVPVEHWFRLGRMLTHTGGETALVSWSGSMFEYLMPTLVMGSFDGTLLAQTHVAAVRRQIVYGQVRGIPWGVSESAYNLRDRHFTYQYHAFGVPNLGLKRGLGRDLVVAPYASVMALMFEPVAALANLSKFEELGALGPYGPRDALDYTRPAPGQAFALVNTFMAHHIGMGFAALVNVLAKGGWPQRFHADPLVRASEMLLHERIPRRLKVRQVQPMRADALPNTTIEEPAERIIDALDTPQPHIALLGRWPYTMMVSHCGSGYSHYEDLALTRWRSDGTCDNSGQFIYIADLTEDRMWSAAHQPVCATPDHYRAILATDRVTFQRTDGKIQSRTEVAASSEDAAEVRRVTLTNTDTRAHELELTSYAEVVLGRMDSDRAHPAFANLFVETEWHKWCTAVTATRRPRSPADRSLWCVHVVDADKDRVGVVSCETDRARFLGRGRTTREPLAMETPGDLSGTTGPVLDPIFALRTRVRIEPGQSVSVAFTTLVATSRERAFELADRYHDSHGAKRALDLAWTATQAELRDLGVTSSEAGMFQDLAAHLFFSTTELRSPQSELRQNRGSQLRLWSQGISGDWPILLAVLDAASGLPTLKQLLSAHSYWRRHGMTVDLVILNMQASGYLQELGDKITAGLFASGDSDTIDRPGGVFVRRVDLLAEADLLMLRATARVHVICDGRPLERILAQQKQSTRTKAVHIAGGHGRKFTPLPKEDRPLTSRPTAEMLFDNGIGGLMPDGRYRIDVTGDVLPPAPWANVVAGPRGGFVVSERGGGYCWAENSYFYRLTPWHNDPVSDPLGEVIYLRDEQSSQVWSATPAPVRTREAFAIHHGAGFSTFEQTHVGIASKLTLSVAEAGAVKVSSLQVTNHSERPRRLTLTSYVEWTLGVLREHTQHQVFTRFDEKLGVMWAQNFFDSQFAGWVAFSAASAMPDSHTGDRRRFIGRNGSLAEPAGMKISELDGVTGGGLDPCAAQRFTFDLAANETREIVFLLGAANGQEAAEQLVSRLRGVDQAKAEVAKTGLEWQTRLGVIKVQTPDPAFDAMLNHWALYQALACRMWARSALYQSSGAYGFRDQLQDAMAFVYAEPGLARAHILLAASRQFIEGDVQHWWHPQSGRGVRTKFSDDLAWLPYVLNHYIRVTGDKDILREQVPFLSMRTLFEDEHEIYDLPSITSETSTVYEHGLRALRRAFTKGAHGLPLIGIGDWNDGMSRVGVEGRGESVWLAWFLATTARDFAIHGDADVASELCAGADAYVAAANDDGWDGQWYRRAFFDDGAPLGSATSDECRIDSIAQSWSVISGGGTPERQHQAMGSFEEHLVDNEARILLLLDPPFDKTAHDPGYIKGYLPGVRENGAQYTHAALWAVLATARLGKADRAFELFQMLNPLLHTQTPEEVAIYKVEPYVVAADVYTAAGHRGRGGWTWYTGSASWMYRVGLEAILGFVKVGDSIAFSPCIPTSWRGFNLQYSFGGSRYDIAVSAGNNTEDASAPAGAMAGVMVDGKMLPGMTLPLIDDGLNHSVKVRLQSAGT